MDIDPEQVWRSGKHPLTVKARSLLCFWAVRKQGFSATELSKKLGVSQPSVSISVMRGEKIAQAGQIELVEDYKVIILWDVPNFLPRNFFIDFGEKIVRPSKDSLIRITSKIIRVEHIENKLILQGIEDGVENVDDGLAWSIAISKKTGKVVLSASGDGVAYVVFATCTAVENFQK